MNEVDHRWTYLVCCRLYQRGRSPIVGFDNPAAAVQHSQRGTLVSGADLKEQVFSLRQGKVTQDAANNHPYLLRDWFGTWFPSRPSLTKQVRLLCAVSRYLDNLGQVRQLGVDAWAEWSFPVR